MNKTLMWTACGVFAMAGVAGAARDRDYKLEQREPVKHVFDTAANSLDVDLISGTITVVGDGGNTIRVEGEKVLRALDQSEMDRAKKDVTLDINEKAGVAQLYENGPFRDRDRVSGQHGFHERNETHYDVAYNLTIHVPKAAALHLRGVNGEIKDQDTTGKFDVKTVNGAITMTGIAGSGSVETLNGQTTVTFRENPKSDSYFKSFNGRVEVTLQPSLAADMRFKTFNGQVYTDFDSTALAAQPGAAQRKNGKFVYRSNDFQGVRVGAGGPELKFETFNGDIRIHKQGQ